MSHACKHTHKSHTLMGFHSTGYQQFKALVKLEGKGKESEKIKLQMSKETLTEYGSWASVARAW
jgi:hypothetical protein